MRYLRKSFLITAGLGIISFYYLFSHVKYITSNGHASSPSSQRPLFDTEIFTAGTPKPANSTYTRTLVMGRLRSEDISWVSQELPDLNTSIYIVDNNDTSLPANKGHEAMVYLTYIIDHYDNLPDIVLFFHAHKTAWHNNILLNIDTAETIKRMSNPHIIRQGYMNSRCHLDPGCPSWLHIDRFPLFYNHKKKPEEPHWTSKLFHQLHPNVTIIPNSISQPCCAQFAVSKERILNRPITDFIHYRNWILKTNLDDKTSGRIMEYTWQFIFTGLFEFCPSQHKCYCDGYGICFEGENGLNDWLKILKVREKYDEKLMSLFKKGKADSDKYRSLQKTRAEIQDRLTHFRNLAIQRGNDPKIRALEAGRDWKDGDGF